MISRTTHLNRAFLKELILLDSIFLSVLEIIGYGFSNKVYRPKNVLATLHSKG